MAVGAGALLLSRMPSLVSSTFSGCSRTRCWHVSNTLPSVPRCCMLVPFLLALPVPASIRRCTGACQCLSVKLRDYAQLLGIVYVGGEAPCVFVLGEYPSRFFCLGSVHDGRAYGYQDVAVRAEGVCFSLCCESHDHPLSSASHRIPHLAASGEGCSCVCVPVLRRLKAACRRALLLWLSLELSGRTPWQDHGAQG